MLKCDLSRIRTEEYNKDLMDFCKFLEVNYSTYRGWESGRSFPPLKAAFDIAEKLNRRIEDIWHK